MSEILIQSKTSTPRLHEKIVHRERLIKLLEENKNKNLIIVCAPAGFGKTTLVLEFLAHQNNNHAWLSVPHKGIEDASTFFEYLISAFKSLNEEFGNNTLDVMQQFTQNPRMSKELVYACTSSFINEFQKYFKNNITFVIDDLHYIVSEKSLKWLNEFFIELFDNIPPSLHVLMVTRIIPDLNMTKLKAKRNLFTITEKELTFDIHETKELLDSIYKFKYSREDVKLLDDNLKGWVTGIHLVLQSYGEDFNKIKYSGEIAYENIFDFFAQEIFDNLGPELQEFLMVTSLMENFGTEISNAVLGINNSKELTDELIKKNLFIQQVRSIQKDGNDNSISYSYHALFRNFLNEKLKKSRISQEIKDLMEKIGDSYLISGDEISAINYYLEGEDFNRAVPLISKNLQILYNSGKYDILWKWYKSIPEDKLNESAELTFYIGYLYIYVNADYQRSLHYLNKALDLYNQSTNEDGIVCCVNIIYGIYIDTGKIAAAKTEIEKLLEAKWKPKNEVRISELLSYVYHKLRQPQKEIELLEKALELCDNHNLDKTSIYRELGCAYHNMGDIREFEKAIFYYEKGLKSEIVVYNKIIDNCNIAVVYNDSGNFANAIKYFQVALKLLANSYSLDLAIVVHSQYALFLQNIGDFEESSKLLEDIYPLAEKNNSLFQLWSITDYLTINYYLSDDKENFLKYLDLDRKYAETLKIEHYKKILLSRDAAFLMKYKLNSSVEEKLLDAYNYFDTRNNLLKNNILCYLSEYYLRINNTKLALKNLLILLSETGLSANDITGSRNLIDFALSRPELTQYKDKVHSAFVEFFDRLNIEGTTDEYKRKMRIEIDKLYDINMSSFGVLQFVSRGATIPESRWQRKKAKSMLAYMMLKPKAKYGKDKLIELFFPDAKAETAEEHFRHAVLSIRNAVKLSYLNILLYEGKMLYLNPDCYFKSDIAEFDENCRIIRSNELSIEEKIQACKNIINLYKGEFMEGSYEPWCEDLRDEYKNKYISASELLLGLLTEKKEIDEMIHYSEKLLKHDKLNETAYLSLVEAYVRSEKKKSARETYSKMLRIYEAELSQKPDPEVTDKIQLLLNI